MWPWFPCANPPDEHRPRTLEAMNIRLLLTLTVVIAAGITLIRRKQAPDLPTAESGSWIAVPAPAAHR